MARARSNGKPRLVEVSEIPRRTRRGIYSDIVEEFVRSKMKTAKIEGSKATAAVAVRKAIGSVEGAKSVKVVTSGGELYLTKE